MLEQITTEASAVGAAGEVALKNLSGRRIRIMPLSDVEEQNPALVCPIVVSLQRALQFGRGFMPCPDVTSKVSFIVL